MKALITLIFLMISFVCMGQLKYPIQTIYKGDSVVILTVKQSLNVNKAIDTQRKIIREQNKKILSQNKKIDSLINVVTKLNGTVDSIQYIADTTYKWADEINLILFELAAGPSLVYTIPPYNSIYFINLDDYNMTSIDYGETIQLIRMTQKEYEYWNELKKQYNQEYYPAVDYFKGIQFKDFEKELRLYEQRIWKNKNILEK
jgi:hypothetical protein